MTTAHPRRFHRRIGTSVAVLAGLAILHVGSAGGLTGLAADVWTYRAQREELAEDEQATADLDGRMALSAARTEFRVGLHDRMLAGHVPIRAAAAEYRACVGPDEVFDRMLAAIAAGSDDAERMANYLLTSLTKSRAVDSPTRHRLADEFRAEFGRHPQFDAPPATGERPVAAGTPFRSP